MTSLMIMTSVIIDKSFVDKTEDEEGSLSVTFFLQILLTKLVPSLV